MKCPYCDKGQVEATYECPGEKAEKVCLKCGEDEIILPGLPHRHHICMLCGRSWISVDSDLMRYWAWFKDKKRAPAHQLELNLNLYPTPLVPLNRAIRQTDL